MDYSPLKKTLIFRLFVDYVNKIKRNRTFHNS